MKDSLFETDRLEVRRLRASDLDAMLAVYGDADAMRWVGDGRVLAHDDALRWLDVTERNVATRGYGMCALVRGDEIAGFCGLVHPRGQEQPELKYALARTHWGAGLATEAARGMLAWGQRAFGLRHVVATTAPENAASQRVLRKAGFAEGALRRDDDGGTTQVFDWHATTWHVFVYGTLKQGFRNFHVNRGTRLPGDFVTAQAYPLYVIGEFGLPWLVNEPGRGERVRGQVFEVDAGTLAGMDLLERVADAGWYTRKALAVQSLQEPDAAPVQAIAYFGSAARVQTDTRHAGPIAEYGPAHQALYRRHL